MRNELTTSVGSFHVAEVARAADVTPATIRYYARSGLLHPVRDPENGYRCFSASDLRRVRFIRQAQTLGLTIGDIKTVLEATDNGEIPCHQVKSLVTRRLESIREQVVELHATEAIMVQTLASWSNLDVPTPINGEICPLIERAVAAVQGVAAGRRHCENGTQPKQRWHGEHGATAMRAHG